MQAVDDRWWNLIAAACVSGAGEKQWRAGLFRELCKLSAEDVLAFDRWFDERVLEAYTFDLTAAKYYATGFGGSDGMYYFRCWLIAQGRTVYYNALQNADSLADLPCDDDWEAEIYAVAQKAWAEVMGNGEDVYPLTLPGRHDGARTLGTPWDDENPDELRRRFPRLAARYRKGNTGKIGDVLRKRFP